MRAIVQDRYGDARTWRLDEIDVPRPGAGEVLLELRAAAIDRGTWHMMAGLPLLIRVMGFGFRGPKQRVPGLDGAGVVAAVGEGVTEFAEGDEVFGIAKGSLAEFALAPVAKLAKKPVSASFEQAASVPVSGLTALEGVQRVARVEAGQSVLILGASGGVGSFAVQIAKRAGARVTGVASAAKAGLVRELGADDVLDYRTQAITDTGELYDAILDIGGNRPLSVLRRALAPRGTLVIVGGEEGGRLLGGLHRQLGALLLSPFTAQRLTTFVAAESGEQVAVLGKMLEAGELRGAVDRVFPLAEAPAAMHELEGGTVRGKLVIAIPG